MSQPIEPPTADHAVRHRLSTRILAQLPSTEQALEALRAMVESGLPGYTEPADEPVAFPDGLDAELRARLEAWEEHANHRAHLWAEDRFRLGFALGSGLYAGLLTTFDW